MAVFRLRSFGGLSLTRDGRPVGGLTDHRKTLALLAVVAASGADGIGRERLMALLWPESDTVHARGALKQMLHFIRRHLGHPEIITGINQISLDPKLISSDVAEFREAISRGNDALAVSLYAGPFLDGVHIDDADELERWATEERLRLSDFYDDALSRQSDAAGNAQKAAADELIAQAYTASRLVSVGTSAAKLHLDEAHAFFKRALAIDPHNARGLCGLGNWHYVMGVGGYAPREESFAKGRELIFAALTADDRCAEVYCSLAKLALYFDDDFHAALNYIRRSLKLDPNDTEALRILAVVSKILGNSSDAVNAAKSAVDRAPETPGLWNALGDALLSAGRHREAIKALKQAIRLRPEYAAAMERIERSHVGLGELETAVEIRRSRLKIEGKTERATLLAQDAKSAGPSRALAMDIRREVEELIREAETTDPFQQYFTTRTAADRIVTGYADLEEWTLAMDWVERAYERRPGRVRRMLTDLPLDRRGLATDSRYVSVMTMAGADDLI